MSPQVDRECVPHFWIVSAGYPVAVTLLSFAIAGAYLQTTGLGVWDWFAHTIYGTIMLLYSFVGAVSYYAIQKDSKYLQSVTEEWTPKWAYYVTAGVGIPLISIFTITITHPFGLGIIIGVLLHTYSSAIVNAIYVHQRFRFIGLF